MSVGIEPSFPFCMGQAGKHHEAWNCHHYRLILFLTFIGRFRQTKASKFLKLALTSSWIHAGAVALTQQGVRAGVDNWFTSQCWAVVSFVTVWAVASLRFLRGACRPLLAAGAIGTWAAPALQWSLHFWGLKEPKLVEDSSEIAWTVFSWVYWTWCSQESS